MRAKSLLHEMETYLKTEVELAQRSSATAGPVLMEVKPPSEGKPLESESSPLIAEKLESDRSRLLREVEIEARQEDVNDVPFKKILVAVDPSPQAMAAIDLAVRLGQGGGVKYALVHVIDDAAGIYEGFAAPVSLMGERCLRRERASILLKSAAERFVRHGRGIDQMPDVEPIIREGPVVPKLIEAAREFGADLIVIGTHGRRGISHLLMGSTAEGVLRQAPCPVLSITARSAE